MRLYFCVDRATGKYLKGLRTTEKGYMLTEKIDEIRFSSEEESFKGVVNTYPSLEIHCMDMEPVPLGEEYEDIDIPEVPPFEVSLAVNKFVEALETLCSFRNVYFVIRTGECDDDGKGIYYDKEDDSICIELS